MLHGNGVTTIPVEIASEVADIGYEYVAAEAVILDALRLSASSGTEVHTVYVEARKEAQARLDKLREQVTRNRAR